MEICNPFLLYARINKMTDLYSIPTQIRRFIFIENFLYSTVPQ